jgi:glycosyltransferase involved in cell wall biosynthesis
MKIPPEFQYAVTVFTATYNRAHLLPRVFDCLTRQTFRHFEWLVVDDGSQDNTLEAVKDLQSKASFPVRYVVKPNGGKPTAVNRGAVEARGAIFAILDSDDWYMPNALERFIYHWESIPEQERQEFVGVTGLCSLPSGELIGTRFPADAFDCDVIDLRYKHRVTGEKSGILRTDVLRQFPYPEDLGKYISESLVWNRIAKTYKTRFVNEVLTVKDFQPGGITDRGRFIQVRDSRASLLCSEELIELGGRLPLAMRVRAYSNFVRHSMHQKMPFRLQLRGAPSKLWFLCCYPIGLFLKITDGRHMRRHQMAEALCGSQGGV